MHADPIEPQLPLPCEDAHDRMTVPGVYADMQPRDESGDRPTMPSPQAALPQQ
jgi:hypothetical protein